MLSLSFKCAFFLIIHEFLLLSVISFGAVHVSLSPKSFIGDVRYSADELCWANEGYKCTS